MFLAAVAAVFVFSGCANSDVDNMSERPWNSPKTWESGVPQTMMQGR